jgi:O-antigen ligase
MINSLLIISILVWPFGQLLTLTPFGNTLRVQLLDLLSVLLFISLIFTSRKNILKTPLFKPFVLFILAALASLIANPDSISLVGVGYFLRFVSYTSFYFAFRIQGIKKYSRHLIIAAGLFLAIGLLQYFFLPDVRFLRYLGFDDHYYRLIGSFFDPNFTGLVLAVLVVLTPWSARLRAKPAAWPARLVLLIALVLTFSRASFLALATGLVYLSLTTRRFKLLLILALLGLLLYLSPKPFGEGVNLLRTFSITSRLMNQRNALLMFAQKPLFGHGFNNLKQTNGNLIPNLSSGVDNSFLFVLVTTGLTGFAAFLYLLKTAYRGLGSPIVRTTMVMILVHSIFNNSFFYSWILAPFFLLISSTAKRSA